MLNVEGDIVGNSPVPFILYILGAPQQRNI